MLLDLGFWLLGLGFGLLGFGFWVLGFLEGLHIGQCRRLRHSGGFGVRSLQGFIAVIWAFLELRGFGCLKGVPLGLSRILKGRGFRDV